MWRNLWELVMRLFGKSSEDASHKQSRKNMGYAAKYKDISEINFTAIVAGKLATLTVSESSIAISGENKRAKLLEDTIEKVWHKIKKITATALGCGGCLIVPYVQNGKLLFNYVSQDRLCINAMSGEKITDATVLADVIEKNNTNYYRYTNYAVNNGNLYITNKTVNESGSIVAVEEWADIQDIAISNVDRVLFGFIKSPVDNRKGIDLYGVPITYGCDSIIEEIKECLVQIKEEFENKQVRLQVDERAFKRDKNGNYIIDSKIFMLGHSNGDGSLFNIFDPAIRDSSYYARLLNLFDLLEKAIGTSKGILTAPESRGATATEIKAGMYDTYAMITDIRTAIEKGMTDFLYACDVLANYYGLSPVGDYKPVFDWSYSMIESSSETWTQMKDGQAIGIRSKAELRSWQTGESLEEAQMRIDEITAREPTVQNLLGMNE
ncbi:MAG: hypothetical protein J6C82_04970 [Clostridia bacterium]|nr:hypothetical protein [Clostridia bacterium]